MAFTSWRSSPGASLLWTAFRQFVKSGRESTGVTNCVGFCSCFGRWVLAWLYLCSVWFGNLGSYIQSRTYIVRERERQRERCDFLAVVSEDCCLLECDIAPSAKISFCFGTVRCLYLGSRRLNRVSCCRRQQCPEILLQMESVWKNILSENGGNNRRMDNIA